MNRKDDTSPATKADLKAGLESLRAEMLDAIKDAAADILRQVAFLNEQLVHDFRDAFDARTSQHSDKIGRLEDRVVTIERRLGMVA